MDINTDINDKKNITKKFLKKIKLNKSKHYVKEN